MKSMHLLLAAVLLTLATVWARAATQGLEQACIYRGRLLPEGFTGKDKSFLKYQLSVAG